MTGGVLLGWWGAKDVGLIAGIAFGLAYGLSFGLIFGPIVAVRNERTRPNDGIRRSARYSLVIGLAVALLVGLFEVLSVGLDGEWLAFSLRQGLQMALLLAPLVGLAFGGDALIRHYAVRAGLTRARAAPWRYGSFLEAMTQRLLLRRAGSSYVFVHRLLRDYLGDSAHTPATVQAAPGGR